MSDTANIKKLLERRPSEHIALTTHPSSETMAPPSKLPSFDQLPLNEGDPPYSAWGLWGEDSALGSLNYLTDEVVAKAVQAVKTGERVALKYVIFDSNTHRS
jgi:hypothetical protein